jgi:hypothetical protein
MHRRRAGQAGHAFASSYLQLLVPEPRLLPARQDRSTNRAWLGVSHSPSGANRHHDLPANMVRDYDMLDPSKLVRQSAPISFLFDHSAEASASALSNAALPCESTFRISIDRSREKLQSVAMRLATFSRRYGYAGRRYGATRLLSPAADMPLHWLRSESCHNRL